jgi:hypothetical protein
MPVIYARIVLTPEQQASGQRKLAARRAAEGRAPAAMATPHRLGQTAAGETAPLSASSCLIHVRDADAVWSALTGLGVTTLEAVEDHGERGAGIRRFLVADPDGNQIRIVSPIP